MNIKKWDFIEKVKGVKYKIKEKDYIRKNHGGFFDFFNTWIASLQNMNREQGLII